jgi:plastocyanin
MRAAVLLTALAAAAALTVAAVALADNPPLKGKVGPGFSISLRDAAGNPVTTLQPGPVSIDVEDLSDEHNFHLTGPGVDVTTEVEEIGSKSFDLTLQDGTYRFVCDPHANSMRGQFTVGGGGGDTGGGGSTGGGGTTTTPPSAPVGSTLVLTSGPGFTISLKTKTGKKVTRLKPGRYTIVARDRSGFHNAHILGAGVNKKTAVPGTTTQTWKVVLKKGTLVFQCDPHKQTMRGVVKVAA